MINGSTSGKLIFTKSDANGIPSVGDKFEIDITDFEKAWIFHPQSNVDLAILPISLILNTAYAQKFEIFTPFLTESTIPISQDIADNIGVISEIFMLGYPNGLWDEVNNLPLLRRGLTATSPIYNFNGKQEFLIDCACFPGSSGSPIFIYKPSGHSTPNGDFIVGRELFYLIGILYAGPQHLASGELEILPIATHNLKVGVPNNLGIAIKSSKLLDFLPILRSKLDKPDTSILQQV